MNPAEAMAKAAQVENALRIVDPYFLDLIEKAKANVFKLPMSGKEDEVFKLRLTVALLESLRGSMRADIQAGEAARKDQQQADKIAAMGPEAAKWAGK